MKRKIEWIGEFKRETLSNYICKYRIRKEKLDKEKDKGFIKLQIQVIGDNNLKVTLVL